MAEGWQYSYTIQAAYRDADPADLTERIIDALEAAGHSTPGEARPAIALGRLAEDGTRPLYVNCTPDPGQTLKALAQGTIPAESKLAKQQRELLARLDAYLANQSPTNAQSVAVIKDLIRVAKALVR